MQSRWISAVCGLVLFAATPVFACFDVDTPPTPFVWFTSATTAEIALAGAVVKAGGINPGDNCAVGLGHSGTIITGIMALSVVDDADPDGGPVPLAGLSFSTNGNTTTDFTTASPSLTWQGFHSSVSSSLTGGSAAAMVFSVTVASGTTYQDIISDLQDFDFLGVDDANLAGNLANTNQSLDGITGVVELPYCYDDTVQPGEVCDGYSNMGCGVGDTCVDCSQCAMTTLATTCKSRLIHDISFNPKSKLKCYATAAKQGMAVSPACLAAVQDLSIIWPKYTSSCPQALPASGTITTLVDTFDNDVANLLPLGATAGSWKCASQKFKAASLRAVNTVKCYSKAYKLNTTVDPTCLTKVDTKFQTKFAQAEAPALCDPGNIGNAATVAARVDSWVNNDVLAPIPPP